MSAMLYGQAIQSGMSALNLMAGGENAETIAAYNNAYNSYATKFATLDVKNAAEDNISAISQDKILSNVAIEQSQSEARAAAMVSAAVAGVSGGSVDAGMYQIDVNASMQKATVNARAAQLTEQQLAQVNSAQSNYNSVPKVQDSSLLSGALTGLGKAVGSLQESDFGNMSAYLSEDDTPTSNLENYQSRQQAGIY